MESSFFGEMDSMGGGDGCEMDGGGGRREWRYPGNPLPKTEEEEREGTFFPFSRVSISGYFTKYPAFLFLLS